MLQPSPGLAGAERQPASLEIHPTRIFKVLVVVLIGIVALGGTANFLIYQALPDPDGAAGRILRRVDIGHEPSLVQWYSSVLFATTAILLGSIGLSRSARNLPDRRYWLLLAAGSAMLSIDESIMIHEMGSRAVEIFMPTRGIFYFGWVIPGVAVVLGCLPLLIRFLYRVDPLTRRRYILAGAIFVGGAIGVEIISGFVAERWLEELPSGQFQSTNSTAMTAMTLCQVVEEAMELLGASIFLVATLDQAVRVEGGLRIYGGKSAS